MTKNLVIFGVKFSYFTKDTFNLVHTLHLSFILSSYNFQKFVFYAYFFLLVAGTGLAAVFINIAVENFAGWKFSVTFNIIQKSYIAGFVVYVLINLALVFSSVYIITQFAPAAAGSGIPEIKGYLNGEIISFEVFGFVLNVDPVKFLVD